MRDHVTELDKIIEDRVRQAKTVLDLRCADEDNWVDDTKALDELVRINTDDFIAAIGLSRRRFSHKALRRLLRPFALKFARQVAEFDQRVRRDGLARAGEWVVQQFGRSYEVSGWSPDWLHGPVLFVSNHPGLTDAPTLFALIDRPDLFVVARHRKFLHALPHTSQRLIYVSDEDAEGKGDRVSSVRQVVSRLRYGQAVLTFPAGNVEPDPAVMTGAAESLQTWSPSIGLIARLAPQTHVVPVIVSGVISVSALRHPLTHIRRSEQDRNWLGATLQAIFRSLQDTQVRLNFGPPMLARDLVAEHKSAGRITQAIIAQAQALLGECLDRNYRSPTLTTAPPGDAGVCNVHGHDIR